MIFLWLPSPLNSGAREANNQQFQGDQRNIPDMGQGSEGVKEILLFITFSNFFIETPMEKSNPEQQREFPHFHIVNFSS